MNKDSTVSGRRIYLGLSILKREWRDGEDRVDDAEGCAGSDEGEEGCKFFHCCCVTEENASSTTGADTDAAENREDNALQKDEEEDEVGEADGVWGFAEAGTGVGAVGPCAVADGGDDDEEERLREAYETGVLGLVNETDSGGRCVRVE